MLESRNGVGCMSDHLHIMKVLYEVTELSAYDVLVRDVRYVGEKYREVRSEKGSVFSSRNISCDIRQMASAACRLSEEQ